MPGCLHGRQLLLRGWLAFASGELICPASGRFDLSSDNRLVAPARGCAAVARRGPARWLMRREWDAIHGRIAQRGLDNLIFEGTVANLDHRDGVVAFFEEPCRDNWFVVVRLADRRLQGLDHRVVVGLVEVHER